MPKRLTLAQAKLLKARGLKDAPHEVEQLTRMMNDDLEREALAVEKAAVLKKRGKVVDR